MFARRPRSHECDITAAPDVALTNEACVDTLAVPPAARRVQTFVHQRASKTIRNLTAAVHYSTPRLTCG